MTALLGACSYQSAELGPEKIVSTTLCADSYLLAMPELKERYGAFSWQSDSSLSTLPDMMQGQYPKAGENREELIRFRPAKIVTGPGTSPLSEPEIHLIWGEDFETVWKNFEILSDRLGADDPSAEFQLRLESLEMSETPLRALYLNRAGGTAGSGTFVDAVFKAVGLTNIIETSGWQSPDTESLLQLDPDIIVTSFLDSNYAGTTDRLTRHAALSQKLAETPQIHIPGKYWPCAGPGLINAAELLSTELQAL